MGEHRNAYPYGGQGYHYIPSQFRHPPPPPAAPIPPPPPPPQFGTANQPYQVHRPPSSASFLEEGASVKDAQGAAQREAEAALHLAASQRHAAQPHEARMMKHMAQRQQGQQGQQEGGMPPPPPPAPPVRPTPPPGPEGV